ncbi:MAG: exonuclease domain-containing protein [Acidimicrobiia bacterium]|nr:exonuclease domain-containing protein [Acidimicrobiia bacterium]
MSGRRFEATVAGVGAVATAVGFVAAAWIVWAVLDEAGRADFSAALNLLVPIGLALMTIGGVVAGRYFRSFMLATRRMTEEIDLIATVNPAHRIDPNGPAHLRKLGWSVNRLAGRLWESLEDREMAVEAGRQAVEHEKERLAALMSDLAQGVVVCNLDGQILLYNGEASHLLADEESNYVGLGRSVFGFLDRNVALNALHHLQLRAERGPRVRPQRFIATIPSGQVLRMTMVAVRNPSGEFTGFVLTMEDVTYERAARSRRDDLLVSLTHDTRRSVAGVRAAIETIRSFPGMSVDDIERFRSVIADEAERLSVRVEEVSREHTGTLESAWELDDMLGDDLLLALANRVEDSTGMPTSTTVAGDAVWVKVDGLAVVDRLASVAVQMADRFQADAMSMDIQEVGRFAALDSRWFGSNITEAMIRTCMLESTDFGGDLESLMVRHGGEVWCETGADGVPVLRVLLPKAVAVPALAVRVLDEGRPEFYDFNLFEQRDAAGNLDDRPLRELVYTVFDTETTGLDPSGGDEIISVGAVRVLNGKLLRYEAFDQLVDPRRPIPAESYAIHRISGEMVAGQPAIEVVLPRFRRFVDDTVLVGHNVAFDLKFLQLKEQSTGIVFANPVLDTLLLAALVYPDSDVHSLEALARLVGVPVTGRHTSLGDALVTAEVFLSLVPQLERMGLETFGEVQAAEKQTFYARLKY